MKTIYICLTLSLSLVIISLSAQPIKVQPIENHALGRSAFNDAKDMVVDNPGNNFDEVLKSYGFESNDDIKKMNEEFNSKIPLFVQKDISNVGIAKIQSANVPLVFSNPSQGIDALGSFIAVRFKEEINIAFLKKFREELDSLPYLGELFPISKKVLKMSDPYNYPVFMETLRQAFEEDLRNVIFNIPMALKDKKVNSPYGQLISIIVNIRDLNNLVVNFNTIANTLPDTTNIIIKKSIYSLAFSVNAINKLGTGDQLFLGNSESSLLNANVDLKNTYIALLLQQNKKYLFGINPQADEILNLITALIPEYGKVGKQISDLSSEVKKGKFTIKLGVETIDVIASSVINAINKFDESKIYPDFKSQKSLEIIGYCQDLNNIVSLIDSSRYGLAAINLIEFLENVVPGKMKPEEKTQFIRYTSFITNVLSAESKDDMMQALETSANPVGSYRVKRNSTFNLSLNSYAGGFVGTNNIDSNRPFLYGFTAPVGLYFGWGNQMRKDKIDHDNGKSFGVFLPIVDVGAVTVFRLKDEKTELADVSWSNVFSPGAYFTFGFGKCPISLNLGGQMGPELNSIDASGKPILVPKEFYWRVSVVVDIPIFDFYTKQQAYKLKNKTK